jgi:cytochrome c
MPLLIAAMVFASALMTATAMAAADAKHGEALYTTRCGACHSVADNGAGPRHRGVFGCRAATQPGFEYSDALRKSGIVWDEKTLDRWLSDPSAFVPGNMMVVRLANEAADRADLIAFLKSVSQGERTCQVDPRVPAAAGTAHP